MIDCGAPVGANMACMTSDMTSEIWSPGAPASAIVGTSGAPNKNVPAAKRRDSGYILCSFFSS